MDHGVAPRVSFLPHHGHASGRSGPKSPVASRPTTYAMRPGARVKAETAFVSLNPASDPGPY